MKIELGGTKEVLTMLDPPTLRGSLQYEVPTRRHTIWCGIPIWYDDLVSIILNVCLISCFSTQESGLLCLRAVRFACLVIDSVTCVKLLSPERGRVRVSPKLDGRKTDYVRNTQHNKMFTTSGGGIHTDAAVTTHKGR